MTRRRESGRVVFISWSVEHGRSRDLAAALGADDVYIGIRRRRRRWLAPFRYVLSTLETVRFFVVRRPTAVFVMIPPSPLAVLALVYGRIARAPVALDAHTAAARAMRTGRRRRSLAWLGRFATLTIVTNAQLAEPLRQRGVTTVIVHDPPVLVAAADGDDGDEDERFTVVAPLSWAPDEPVEQIVDAARRCPDIAFVATGSPPAEITQRRDLPANLELAGFLDSVRFDGVLRRAGVVLALTTREATMQRAGYEALALGRPIVASDTQVLREFFGDAALFARDGASLAAAVRNARDRAAELTVAVRARHQATMTDFEAARGEVIRLMGLADSAEIGRA